MKIISMFPIGTIHTPYKDLVGMPIQPTGARGVDGWIEILPDFMPGLKDLDGFSHLILLYHFHQSDGYALQPRPFLDANPKGVFSTRSPKRPNPIGLSIVQFVRIEDMVIHISDVDIVDGTPLLDIKPYVPVFDHREDAKIGWLTEKIGEVEHFKSDNRFNA